MKRIILIIVPLLMWAGIHIKGQNIDTVNDLQSIPDVTATYTLTSDFIDDFVNQNKSIELPSLQSGVTVTLDGGNGVLPGIQKKHFIIPAGNEGIYIIKNITLQGGIDATSKGVGGINNSGAILKIENIAFCYITGNVISNSNGQLDLFSCTFNDNGNSIHDRNINTTDSELNINSCIFTDIVGGGLSVSGTAIVKNCLFSNISGSYGGGIDFRSGFLDVKKSSFINITNTNWNYWGGAIANHKGSGDAIIENCYFENNKAQSRGAAIGLYYFAGKMDITNCYFIGNEATQNDFNGDGGAVALFNNGQEAELNVEGSTFVDNIAPDDAGALFYEGQGSNRVSGAVKNCTFVGNKGLNDYVNPDSKIKIYDSGGAVQLSLNADVKFINNTFYNNSKGGKGGALGYHWHLTNGAPTMFLINNLFIGNISTTEKNNNVQLYGVKLNKGNIGIDNGQSLNTNLSVESTLGSTTPELSTNLSQIKAGSSIDGICDAIIIPTLMISPNLGGPYSDKIFADGNGHGTDIGIELPLTDQRGLTRVDPKDAGSVEILWAKFDAYIDGTDDGYWEGLADFNYNGTVFYEKDNNEKSKEYFVVSFYDGTIDDISIKPTHPNGNTFLGWMEIDEDGDELGEWDGESFVIDSNRRFRAIWEGNTSTPLLKVTYDSNGGNGGSETFNCTAENKHTILNYNDALLDFTPPTVNHSFNGWNTETDGTGDPYVVDSEEIFTADMILYAQWKYTSPGTDPEPEPEPEPELEAILQWSVSTTDNREVSFVDVEDQTTTLVEEGTPVYLQIRPIVDNPSAFDSWGIQYTAVPADYHYGMSPISGTLRYNFNNGNPHKLVGKYIYRVHSLTLYKNRRVVGDFDFTDSPYMHTIIINQKPDPNPDQALLIKPIAPYCENETDIRIPFDLLYKEYPLQYILQFSDEAKKAGFKDITEYTQLPESNYISISVPSGVSKGKYKGTIIISSKDNELLITDYPFEFEVLEPVSIIEQPVSVTQQKVGDSFTLSVKAVGVNLKYQWFHNGQKIKGATSKDYKAPMDTDHEGIYYVEVYGDCGWDQSEEATVSSCFTALLKWKDVMYVQNLDGRYERFQWYKDGQAITTYGTSIYYTDPDGLLGSYFVRAYKKDGSYDQSCSLEFSTLTRTSSVSVYPTVIHQNNSINIESDEMGESYQGALVEIFSITGQKVYSCRMNSAKLELPVNQSAGVYLIHITPESGRRNIEKIIIK